MSFQFAWEFIQQQLKQLYLYYCNKLSQSKEITQLRQNKQQGIMFCYQFIYLNIMSTDFDEITLSIAQQQKRIQQNQIERNKKFNQCLQQYLNHLKQETRQLDSTEQKNDARNDMISSVFQNVYERIMTSSQIALRKVKDTCYQKKQFWNKLIVNNADLVDLELKKDFYAQKRDAQQRYFQAIENQKIKKIPYRLLLGKLKQKNHNLKYWQDNNKKLQQEVVKGTKTLKQWNINDNKKGTGVYARGTSNQSEYFINQFATQPETRQWNRTPLQTSRYNSYDEGNSILKNFQMKRN